MGEERKREKTDAEQIILALAEKVKELDARVAMQQRQVEALINTMNQYQEVMEKIAEAVKTGGSGGMGSEALALILRALTGGGGDDKLISFFIRETLRTNLLLQRTLLQGIAKIYGVKLEKMKSEEEEE